jgi:hypothetical protein
MKAYKKTYTLLERLERRGINASFEQANTLRRAELTLHRWAELECGWDTPQSLGEWGASKCYERDETTGKPYLAVYPYKQGVKSYKVPIADREKGALKRIAAVCSSLNIHFYHQTDPRGCALYVSKDPISSNAYTNGVNCNG